MKVLFLDFDGVITTPPEWKLVSSRIKLIKELVDKTGVKIVVSSSVRHGLGRYFSQELKRQPDDEMILWLKDNIYDITPTKSSERGQEIAAWLDIHSEVDNYVILDDDSDMLDSQLFHFVQTDYQTGITEHEYELAYRILMGKYIFNVIGLNFEIRDRWRKKCEGNIDLWEETIKYNDLPQDYEL